MRALCAGLFASLASLLAGCQPMNPQALSVGSSRLEDVRRHMGEPESERRNAAGQRVLYFTNLPSGQETYAVTLDRNEVVTAVQQLLTPENYQRVEPGMTRDDVLLLLGRPISRQTFPLKQQEVWDWPYHFGAQEMRFNVHFDATSGKVVETSRLALQNE